MRGERRETVGKERQQWVVGGVWERESNTTLSILHTHITQPMTQQVLRAFPTVATAVRLYELNILAGCCPTKLQNASISHG